MRTREGWLGGALLLLGLAWGCGGDDDSDGGDGTAGGGGSSGASGSSGSSGRSGSGSGAAAGEGGTPGSGGSTAEGGAGGDMGEAGSVANAGAGGGGAPEIAWYVDADDGDDGNAGTEEAPFQTIEHALSVAEAGHVVYLLPAMFGPATEATFGDGPSAVLQVPAGVTIAALTPGTVTLVNGSSGGLELAGSATLRELAFTNFVPALRGSTGTWTLEGLSFDATANSCGTGGDRAFIEIDGDVVATLSAGDSAVALGDSGECFARVEGTASLSLQGVDLSGALASDDEALLTVLDDGVLALDGVSIDGAIEPIAAGGQAVVTATGATMIDAGGGDYAVRLTGGASFTLSGGSTVTNASFTCIVGDGSGAAATPAITVLDSTLSDCATGIGYYIESVPVVELDGATITGTTFDGVKMVHGGSLTVTDSVFTQNDGNGIGTDGINDTIDVTVRGTQFTDNGGAGIIVRSAGDSTWDLGRGNDPGGNTFTGNDASFGGVRLNLAAAADSTLIYAAGNTWIADEQGADGNGHYSVTSGTFSDVTTGSGPNYSIVNGVLRIAEDP